MPRVKSGVISKKRRKNVLAKAKGFRYGRKSKYRLAHDALLHAGEHAIRGRKEKKRNYRRLWQVKINAFARSHETTYSKFIDLLKKGKVEIDRKILAELCEKDPMVVEAILKHITK